MIPQDEISFLWRKIAKLNELLWEYKAHKSSVDLWLSNFKDQEEKDYSLYILSKFIYYGDIFLRELLKSLYRDIYRYPIIEQIRKAHADTLDETLIESKFLRIRDNTLFLPMGHNSESGGHLLYPFRQTNNLPVDLFKEDRDPTTVERIIFIDDFCGTGSQVTQNDVLEKIRQVKASFNNASLDYYMLIGTSAGIKCLKESKLFGDVRPVVELDSSFKCFSENSRLFPPDSLFDKTTAKAICETYGTILLCKDLSLGFGNSELLLGFQHNTPDNTLPIIWCDEGNIEWNPIFKRYSKKYGKLY